jgi:hypothetical protein
MKERVGLVHRAMTYKTNIYRGVDKLGILSEQWEAVLRQVLTPRFYHLRGWWQSYASALVADGNEFMIALVEDGTRPVCVAPLERREVKRAGLKVREVGLPRHDHIPLNDIICQSGLSGSEFIESLGRALAVTGGWDVLVFKWVLEGSAISELLKKDPMSVVTRPNFCDYLDCSRPYETIFAGFSSNFRSNLNKARNRLKRESGVTFSAVTDVAELPRAFAEFLRIEASGWKGKTGARTAIELDASLVKFYLALIDELGPKGHIVINLLRVGSAIIAAQVCALVGETLYVLKLAYDESWSRVAPGNMLMEWVIQKASESRSFRFLNMVNDPSWFKAWGVQSVPLLIIERYNKTPAGVALMLVRRAKLWIRPAYVRCRDWLRHQRDNLVRRDGGAQALEKPASDPNGAPGKTQQ